MYECDDCGDDENEQDACFQKNCDRARVMPTSVVIAMTMTMSNMRLSETSGVATAMPTHVVTAMRMPMSNMQAFKKTLRRC